MLPSIPVSPLIQQSLNCASQLAQLTEKIANQQQEEIEYYEQQSITQRIKLDLITKQMHSVRDLLYHNWQPEALAKQIVIINVDLFLHHDVKRLNDFHTYLLHSLSHQIIISSHSHAAFDFAIRLARCLQQYRDWNGCMAVLRCLSLSSIQNHSSTSPFTHDFPWMQQDIDSSYLKAFQQSLLSLRPYSLELQEQKRTRSLSTSSFYARKKKDNFVIAIPWFPPLLELVSEQDRALYMDICRYNQWPKQPNITKALFNLHNNSSSLNIPPMLPSSTIFDLSTSLGQGDLLICHWLLSRAFLTLDQLDLESEIINSTSTEIQELEQQITSDIVIVKDSIDNEESQQEYQTKEEEEEEEEEEEKEEEAMEENEQHYQHQIIEEEIEEVVVAEEEVEGAKHQYDNVTADTIDNKTSGEIDIDITPSSTTALLNKDVDINNNNKDDGINNNDKNNSSSNSKNDNLDIILLGNGSDTIESENKISEANIPLTSTSASLNDTRVESTELVTHNQDNTETSLYNTIHPLNSIKNYSRSVDKEQQNHLLNNNNNNNNNNSNENIEEIINESYTKHDKQIGISSSESTNKLVSNHQKEPIANNNATQSLNEKSPNHKDEIIHVSDEKNNKNSNINAFDDVNKIEDNGDNTNDMMENINNDTQSIKKNNNINNNNTNLEEKKVKENDDNASEQWTGYPTPEVSMEDINQDGDAEDEIWTGYPGPDQHEYHHDKAVSSDEASEEEWKGYHATSEEAKWQEETILKVQQQEWIGYTLETLDEDELDSNTVISNRYDKPYQSANSLLNNHIQSSS